MAREGMDVGAVTSDGTRMKTIGDNEIPHVISQVNSIIQSMQSQWWGPDAQAFVNAWESTDRPNLTNAAQEISNFGQHALTNAQEQTTTSSN
jgi:hypothetical protein